MLENAAGSQPNPAVGGHRFWRVVERAHRESTDAPPPPRIETGQYTAGLWGLMGFTAAPCLVRSDAGVCLLTQWNQLAHQPLPSSRSARVPMHACNRCTARLIPRSWLQERCCERGVYVIRGGRPLSVLSRRRDLQKPYSIGVLSAFLGRGTDRRWGFGNSYVEG